jgi:hypothetical protein
VIIGTTPAVTAGIAAPNYKIGNHPVENQSAIKSAVYKVKESGGGIGRIIPVTADHKRAFICRYFNVRMKSVLI